MAEFSKENPAAEEAMEPVSRNFIEQMIDKDLEEGVYETVHTRKNKIFQSRDLCLRALDTNSACAKSVRRNERKD